ncbi:MAG: ABC transporter ATP-binding protein/permease [Treponema sp.]|nr:ABC transporter ATP-binding protein/permease [Treponema sp.]
MKTDLGRFKKAIFSIAGYLPEYKFAILFSLILTAGSSVLSIFGPLLLGNITNIIFEGIRGGGGIDFAAIGRGVLRLLGLYLIGTGFAYLQGWLMSGVSLRIAYRMRKAIAEKIGRLPFGYFDTQTHGDTLSRMTNDVDAASGTLSQSLTQLMSALTTFCGAFIMMFRISWPMALAAVLIVPLGFVFLRLSVRYSQKYFARQQAHLGKLNGHVEEMFSAHDIIKAFNGEEKSVRDFDTYNEDLRDTAWRVQFFFGLMMPAMTFIGNLGYVVIAVLGGWLALAGRITLGGIQAFIQYVRIFIQNMGQGAEITGSLQQTAAAAERIFAFLDAAEESPDPPEALIPADISGAVSFNRVCFGYTADRQVLRDFSADIQPGSRVAIVGPTGAGKTTLVKLLMRFYDVNGGAITLDGRDIRSFKRDDLRSLFGMVLQDTWLFKGTIRENIRYGKLSATDEEVAAAAKAAYADHFIRALPGGYDLVLDENGGNISQGQKQLLTIARAILADPKILILDEATSSVDTRTEVLIQKAMDDLMKGRTSFVIAHRLSTIRNADIIEVMENGAIVEQGNHDELINRKGVYAALYQSQFENAPAPVEPPFSRRP